MQNSKCYNCEVLEATGSLECCENCVNNVNLDQIENITQEEKRPTWDKTFMDIAKIIAKRSKDPHTKVGCVIVKDHRILSVGYNGEPRDFKYDFNWNTQEKYDYVIHAELNAIANANYNNLSVKDATVYLTLSPCKDCIKLLIQHGIKKVYYLREYKDFKQTKFISDKSNIELIQFK